MNNTDENADKQTATSSRPVGRPRQKGGGAASKNPRTEILKAAAKLFSMKGYAGTTMAEIADAVGIRGPSLYYHFSDKSDVLRALAKVGLDYALQDSHALREDTTRSAASRLYQLLHEVTFRLRASPYELNCLFDPAFHTSDFKDVNQRVRTWLADLHAMIAEGMEKEVFWGGDSRIATFLCRGLVESAIREMGGFRSYTPEQSADHVADFALRALLRDKEQLTQLRADVSYELQ